ncbi:Dyp-type peroxidase [Nocardiopsis tropica]|uniref:Dyp-type peroxidase n=1 Tax=Nocardiopsis tropica TaxID=109330 RepID=A0ABU7KK72_9ACTN|nr:Dyp-type peroxidase [Nocardiopsis umidischolae]MEE2049686.1 Dyp-type peroxidase [Nocardiopsis umidischolae]
MSAPDRIPDGEQSSQRGVGRRRFLGSLGLAGIGGAALGAGGTAGALSLANDGTTPLSTVGERTIAFHGPHQAGITDAQQARVDLRAYDLAPDTGRAALQRMLRGWTTLAERLTRGGWTDADAPVLGSGPSALTVTVAFGASLFDKVPELADRRPARMIPLPEFAGDELDPSRGEGDVLVQVCADDALVAAHAARMLGREASQAASVRWHMSGFTRSQGVHPDSAATQRNLMGQLDGTGNPRPDDEDFTDTVLVSAGGEPDWIHGGSYLVMRRIRMLLDTWEELGTGAQERVIGRRKDTGAPLSGGEERTEPDFDARGDDGIHLIAPDAHVRMAHPDTNLGTTMLRRGYSYDDGPREDGAPDAGLLFLAWQADPLNGFVPVQEQLSRGDALNRFVRHEASGQYAAPGGVAEDEYLGQRLLEG